MRYLAILLLLAGCVSAEEVERREIAECTNLGFKPKTEAFGQCRLQLRSIKSNEQSAAAATTGVAQQNYWNTYNAVTAPFRHY